MNKLADRWRCQVRIGFWRALGAALAAAALSACATAGGSVEAGRQAERAKDWGVTGELISPIAMDQGLRFAVREGGKTVGSGVVTEILA